MSSHALWWGFHIIDLSEQIEPEGGDLGNTIRMIVGDQAGRVSNVFKNMMKEQPIDN